MLSEQIKILDSELQKNTGHLTLEQKRTLYITTLQYTFFSMRFPQNQRAVTGSVVGMRMLTKLQIA